MGDLGLHKFPSVRSSVHSSIRQHLPWVFWALLVLQFCINLFETLQVFSSWYEDVCVVWISFLDYFLSLFPLCEGGARWLSGRVSDSGARGPGFETYRRRVVSLSKTLYSPKVLVNYPGSDGSVPTWLKNCWLGRYASTQPTNHFVNLVFFDLNV